MKHYSICPFCLGSGHILAKPNNFATAGVPQPANCRACGGTGIITDAPALESRLSTLEERVAALEMDRPVKQRIF